MTGRMASRWMTVWRLDTGIKAIRKDAVKVETTVQLRGRYRKESEEMQIEALKETRGLKEMCGEGISFPQ